MKLRIFNGPLLYPWAWKWAYMYKARGPIYGLFLQPKFTFFFLHKNDEFKFEILCAIICQVLGKLRGADLNFLNEWGVDSYHLFCHSLPSSSPLICGYFTWYVFSSFQFLRLILIFIPPKLQSFFYLCTSFLIFTDWIVSLYILI